MNPDPLLKEAATGDLTSLGVYLDRCQEKNCLLEGVLALLTVRQKEVEKRLLVMKIGELQASPVYEVAPFHQIGPGYSIDPGQTPPTLTQLPSEVSPKWVERFYSSRMGDSE